MRKARSLKRQTSQETVDYIQYSRKKDNLVELQKFTNDMIWEDESKVYLITNQIDKNGDILSLEIEPGDYIIKDIHNTLHLYSEVGFINNYKLIIV